MEQIIIKMFMSMNFAVGFPVRDCAIFLFVDNESLDGLSTHFLEPFPE